MISPHPKCRAGSQTTSAAAEYFWRNDAAGKRRLAEPHAVYSHLTLIERRKSMVVDLGRSRYVISKLETDQAVASKAYRLKKQTGDEAVYDVYVDRYGAHCDCLGYLRWSNPCKHIRLLRAAGMI
jgi:hypothetical protein